MAKKKTAKRTAAKCSKAEVEKYVELQLRIAELNKEARRLDKEADVIKAKLKEALAASGGDELQIGNRVVYYKSRSGRVAWKDLYENVAGPTAVAQAKADCPAVLSLAVE